MSDSWHSVATLQTVAWLMICKHWLSDPLSQQKWPMFALQFCGAKNDWQRQFHMWALIGTCTKLIQTGTHQVKLKLYFHQTYRNSNMHLNGIAEKTFQPNTSSFYHVWFFNQRLIFPTEPKRKFCADNFFSKKNIHL